MDSKIARTGSYRKGVGIMILNKDKKIFVGKRIDNNSNAWQMPQGGIDEGEDEDMAMLRELKEETGIEEVQILAKSEEYYYYDLPSNLQKIFWGGKYLGQKQRWYLVDFLGSDSQVNITAHNPEFSEWQWVGKEEMIKIIVAFKRGLYVNVLEEFKDHL